MTGGRGATPERRTRPIEIYPHEYICGNLKTHEWLQGSYSVHAAFYLLPLSLFLSSFCHFTKYSGKGLSMKMLGVFTAIVLGCMPQLVQAAPETGRASGVIAVLPAASDNRAMVAYTVVLDRRLAADELDTISNRIKRAAPKSELILISFFLRGMRPEQDAWATSYFTQKLGSFAVRVNEANTQTNLPDRDLQVAGR
jgi:hypothetical protein